MSHLRSLALVALGVALAACGDTISPTEVRGAVVPACDGPLTVQVTGSARPVFSWTPACGITSLTVTLENPPATATMPLWGVTGPENHPLGPTITYGVPPQRATVWSGPSSLILGQRYRVTVQYIVGGDVPTATGSAVFATHASD